jgi:hypothetical protein
MTMTGPASLASRLLRPTLAPAPGEAASDDAQGGIVVAYALGLLAAGLVAGGFGLGVYTQNLHNGLIAAGFTAVGVFVISRRPANREAWLFLATGVAHAVMFFARQYGLSAGDAGETLPAVEWVTWTGVWPLPLVLVLVGVTIMSFPDAAVGRAQPGTRTRRPVRRARVGGRRRRRRVRRDVVDRLGRGTCGRRVMATESWPRPTFRHPDGS